MAVNSDEGSDIIPGVPGTINQGCIAFNPATEVIVKALGAVASVSNRTVGYGIRGSAGAGTGVFGLNASSSAQIVVGPDGSSGLAISYIQPTLQGMFGVASGGAGGVAEAQFSASTVGTVSDLAGQGINAGAFLGDDAAVGFDTTFGVANGQLTQQVNLTLGFGFGGGGHAAARTNTVVIPSC